MGAALIPAIVAAVGGVAAGVGTAAIVQTFFVNLFLGFVQTRLAKRGRNQGPPAIGVSIRGPVEHRRIVLGTRRCGGIIAFFGTSTTDSGTTGDLLTYIVVYTGHQVAAIRDVWIDQERIADADINAGTGAVTGGKFAGKVVITKYLGTGAQTADPYTESVFTAWTTDHRLRGCAYIAIRFTRDDTVFDAGAPQSVSALIDGARCYDPRLDSTNGGAGACRSADPSTWVSTRNPALHLAWYLSGGSVVNDQSTRMLRYGLREPDSRMSFPHLTAAANICDETLSGSNATPAGSDTRYRCDIEVTCSETHREIIEAILATMAGSLVNVHGQWRINAGAYITPVHTVNQNDLYDKIQISDTDPHDQRYNAVAAVYFDAQDQYLEQTTIFRTDAAYETADGGERIPDELRLRGVTNQYQAQRLAEVRLRQSRMMRSIEIVGALNLLKIALNEAMLFSHTRLGWNSRIFRCIGRQPVFNENAGAVTISARRDDPAVWSDLLLGDYYTGRSTTDTFTRDGPPAPTALTITPKRDGILFSWTLPPQHFGGMKKVQLFEHTASTPFSAATMVWEGYASNYFLTRLDRVTRYYWIRNALTSGPVSGTFPTSTGMAGTTQTLNRWIERGSAFASEREAYITISASDGASWTGLWGCYTVEKFSGACHIIAKHTPNTGTAHTFIGLCSDAPNADDYPDIDFGFHTGFAPGTPSLNVNIFELGANMGIFATVFSASTEFAITYDGTNVRYYLDRVVVRTVSAPGRSFYGLIAFNRNSPGSAVNSMGWAPWVHLPLIETVQITSSAATDIYTTTVASANILGVTAGPPGILVASLSIPAYPYATQHIVTAAGTVMMNAPSQVFSSCAVIRDFNSGVATVSDNNVIARNPSTSLPEARGSYAREVWYSVAANTAKTFYLWALAGPPTVGGSSASLLDTTFKTEVIKR